MGLDLRFIFLFFFFFLLVFFNLEIFVDFFFHIK